MGKPELFWSPPDGAPITGITTYQGLVVIATGSGVWVVTDGQVPENWTIHKISLAVKNNERPD